MTHIPVLKDESINGLLIESGDVVVDGTLGAAGHTKEIIDRYENKVKIIAFDLDKDAIERSILFLKEKKKDVVFVNRGFQEIDEVLLELNIDFVDRIILDLGISSFQIEESQRGFSFLRDEPLLMTMKEKPKDTDLTAYDIVNTWEEESLADIIYGFGEEKYSRKIAKKIVEARKEKEIKTTFDLVEIIEKAVGQNYRRLKIHPATRTFQALRIATNSELVNLEQVIEKSVKILKGNGRLAIITFHSLEDRIVKKAFVKLKEEGLVKIITKKPIIPSDEELKINPRSRSAKLRIIEKI
jgi:16S rRNA (cytosine1402-N4)-methyltransferase